jgi:phosphoserine phosphatase RsbU/P
MTHTTNEPYRISCHEIWGGNESTDFDICTRGVTASMFSHTGGRAGGDLYYFTLCGSDKLTRILLADVRGHGEEVSAISRWIYDGLARRMNSLDGAGVLQELNALVTEKGFAALTTAALVSHYLGTNKLYYSYAGHPPAIINQNRARNWLPLELLTPTTGPSNLPLGVMKTTQYTQDEIPIHPGEKLLLYTDGLTECPLLGHPDQMLETLGLQSWLEQAPAQDPHSLKTHLTENLKESAGPDLPHDDCTLIALEFH